MTNQRHTVYYTGITNNLAYRIYQHKNKLNKGFTARYNINKLIYYEIFYHPDEAIEREKQIKKLHRANKIKLITKNNPNFNDLTDDFL